jgi:hypothetical protein
MKTKVLGILALVGAAAVTGVSIAGVSGFQSNIDAAAGTVAFGTGNGFFNHIMTTKLANSDTALTKAQTTYNFIKDNPSTYSYTYNSTHVIMEIAAGYDGNGYGGTVNTNNTTMITSTWSGTTSKQAPAFAFLVGLKNVRSATINTDVNTGVVIGHFLSADASTILTSSSHTAATTTCTLDGSAATSDPSWLFVTVTGLFGTTSISLTSVSFTWEQNC